MNSHLAIPRPALTRAAARKIGLLLALAILGQLAIVTATADAAAARWFLRNSHSAGPANIILDYGNWGGTMTHVTGDWNGDGVDTPGVFDTAGGSPANWYLRNSNSTGPHNIFREYGLASGRPVVGNWNCEGDQTNVYKDGAWYLRRADGTTQHENFGGSAWVPPMGTWGACTDDLLVQNPSTGQWKYRFNNGTQQITFYYGSPGDIALLGDWDGDGLAEPGVYRSSTGMFYLAMNSPYWNSTQYSFQYGTPNAGSRPVAGDWNGDGIDTVGLINMAS